MCAQTDVLLPYDIVEHKKAQYIKEKNERIMKQNCFGYDIRAISVFIFCVCTVRRAFVFAPSLCCGLLCASVWSTIVAIGPFYPLLFLIIGYAILPSPLSQRRRSLFSAEHIFTAGVLALCKCVQATKRLFENVWYTFNVRKLRAGTMIENYYFVRLYAAAL